MIRAKTLTGILAPPKNNPGLDPIIAPMQHPATPDIASIISLAIIEASRNSDNAALVIGNALQNLPQPTIVQSPDGKQITGFNVIRDRNGNMSQLMIIREK